MKSQQSTYGLRGAAQTSGVRVKSGSIAGAISREPAGVVVRNKRNRKRGDGQMGRGHVGMATG